MLIPIVTLLIGAMLTQPAPPPGNPQTWTHSEYGETLLRPFPHAPYPHKSRENGYVYDGQTFSAADHYSDSTVGIFIPAGYHASSTVDYVVHFHGWSNHVSAVLDHYQLREQMHASGVNAILLVPQGPKDAQDSGGGKLELDPGAFKALIDEITDFLVMEGKIHTHAIGKIVLSTHSGGYAVTSAVLDHGGLTDHITDVLLFDSSYGGLDKFAAWVSAGKKRRLVSIFTAHLAPENYMLITMLQKAHSPYTANMETEIDEPLLSPREAHFFHTIDIPHDEIMQKRSFFSLFLKTSAIQKIVAGR